MNGNRQVRVFSDMGVRDVIESLKKRRIDVCFVENKQGAREEILKAIPDDETVGIGGSVTIQEIGLIDGLRRKGCDVLWHWTCPVEEVEITRKKASRARYFLTGTNALTEDGRLVNIDGIGNRVSAMVFGPETVIVVAGVNKIVPDLDTALDRIKNVVSPLNARRLNLDLPCARRGKCTDCHHDLRICNVVTIIEGKPLHTNLKVLLVGEELGF